MQNAELRTARDEVETALGKYVNLYDFALVSYFTFDLNCAVSAVNLSDSSLLDLSYATTISEFQQHCPHDSSIPQLNFS